MFFNHSLHTNAESRTTVLIETVVRLSPTPPVPKHRNVNILAQTYGGGIFLSCIFHKVIFCISFQTGQNVYRYLIAQGQVPDCVSPK